MNSLDPLKSIELNSSERERLDSAIFSYIQGSNRESVRFSESVRHKHHNALTFLLTLRPKFSMTSKIVLTLIFALSAGTAGAAEFSAPGQLLYPVKVSINEEVRAAVAVGAEADAQWSIRRIERRAEEAERLAVEGTLSADAGARLAMEVDSHVSSTHASIQRLEAQGRSEEASQLQLRLESTLSTFSQSLSQRLDVETTSDAGVEASDSEDGSSATVEGGIEAEVRLNSQPLFQQLNTSIESTQQILIDSQTTVGDASVDSEVQAETDTAVEVLTDIEQEADVEANAQTDVEASSTMDSVDTIQAEVDAAVETRGGISL